MNSNQNQPNDMRRPLFGGLNSAAEFVTPGHPDKTCDQIAGKILDAALKISPEAHAAIEMVACNGKIVIGGEVSSDVYSDFKNDNNFKKIKDIVQEVFSTLGYDPSIKGFEIEVDVILNEQSLDIKNGDGKGGVKAENRQDVGAGDQGVMCGYAIYSPEREHMPAAFWYSQRLAMRLHKVAITDRSIKNLFADGKTQVVIKNGEISHVTIAIQHGEEWLDAHGVVNNEAIKNKIIKLVVEPVTGPVKSVIVNGTGKFVKGSIWADSAEVGRKIVIDQMGPDCPVGGGSLNGKDPSKVDLTGAVMARYIAKNIVAHGLADEALVQFAFTIGQAVPDQINIFAPGWKLRGISPEEWCLQNFKVTVAGMIEELDLKNPKGWSYEQAARFGFYGHPMFPWEKIKQIQSYTSSEQEVGNSVLSA
jgi:S-adenosylmethionine synthetase